MSIDSQTSEARVSGIGASPGAGVGPGVLVLTDAPEIVGEFADPAATWAHSIAAVTEDLERLSLQARARDRDEAADVLAAQALIAQDPMLGDGVSERIGNGEALPDALAAVGDEIITMFRSLDDEYLAQRADDVAEVVQRLRWSLAGQTPPDLADLAEPSVLVADALTAAQTSQLDPSKVIGFVTERGGPTSHVVVIARSLGVPAVVAAEGVVAAFVPDTHVTLDGASGEVVIDPSPATLAEVEASIAENERRREFTETYRGTRVSFGDRPMTVAANVATGADVDAGVAAGADGVGLLRTEFLFLDRDAPPSEDEQREFYARAVDAFDDPVVIRTFDIGGDKPAPYLDVPEEENPFLGVRGARLYRLFPDLFEAQVRAIAAVATEREVWMMLPMITTVAEVVELRAWIEEIRATAAHPGQLKIGVMVEVPAIALTADAVAPHVDFFSIGSNDLTQYAMAADRMSDGLGHLQDPMHPAVMSLCAMTAAAGRRHGVPTAVCGLAAADTTAAALFAAMGIGKLSVSGRMVNEIKATVDALPADGAAEVVEQALAAASAADARSVVAEWRGGE